MPTYEYVCDACGHEFERFQKITEDPLKTCPDCGRSTARRRISAGGGVLFRGPGFYATDYRKQPPAEKKQTGEPKSGEKSGNGGSKKPGPSGAKGGGESGD